MVTLCYLRRYLHLLGDLLQESDAGTFDVSDEVVRWFEEIGAVLEQHRGLLQGPVDAARRKSFMDAMGAANDAYRSAAYRGLCGDKRPLEKKQLLAFASRAIEFIDHSLARGRRKDGLYDAYNLLDFGAGGFAVEPLDEMLEGQVAVLSSGYLDGKAALELLRALRASRLYREDQRSYLLYPDRKLPAFLEKNVIPPSVVQGMEWFDNELSSGRRDYVERDLDGRVHFNGAFTNAKDLRTALDEDPSVDAADARRLCEIYEAVFVHRKFTGRSGSMYKYEGLGCVFWHMVSKLSLAAAEATAAAVAAGAEPSVVDALRSCFREIHGGLGTRKTPAEYGAFPIDAYSHTPGFSGAQQPGLTGQVKEDVISRFLQLGVRVTGGEVVFEPLLLDREEFIDEPATWRYSNGGPAQEQELSSGSLAFTLCGVPVLYRLSSASRLQVFTEDGASTVLDGARLGKDMSRSLFRREPGIRKLVVDIDEASLR